MNKYEGKIIDGPKKGEHLVHYAKKYKVNQLFGEVVVEGEYRFGNGVWIWYGPNVIVLPEK